ncbi:MULTISPECIES: SpoIIE family protein phosphatase [unclassified Methylobacterium]|uniref:SpoIIE family protein phosphatase n=1 Tax=unclassified Methylobacterium TaxID=2615210 RepID=UPI0006F4B64E|nr:MULTISPECIES: SpoIIE family protein phosphatase [unclassified Methylobacterium]KQO52265.1 serine/threonine protein phosphatase [Methylobacterium sp. Leaf85]TXN29050.1 SpoIIE family protein phosphatase [Methylobacterium sp. WL19]
MTFDPAAEGATPAVASPTRKRSLRGGGPLRGDDFLELAGFTDVSTSAPGTMRPGALRGSARGRDLDSLAHTLFLRIYPVIAIVVLATQVGIAWVNYNDSLRLYTERANLLVALTAQAIARPDWSERPDVYTTQVQALTLDPAFRFVRAWNAEGGLVMSIGEMPGGRGIELIRASTAITLAGQAKPVGSLTLGLSTEALRANAEKQALLAVGASLVLMLAFVLTLHANVRKHVLAPLKRLLLAMREVEHKRWSTVAFDGAIRASNEIDVISSAFNRMVEGLRAGDEAKQLLADLELAHAKLADANHQVMESIGYARRIQTSVLPDRMALAGAGLDVAVLWEPLHQVGGDYFWLERLGDVSIIVVADCTGHGVPGAFITLIVATALDRVLHERGLRSPAEILTVLDEMVRAQLRQDGRGSDSDDGLDCGLCIWDPEARRLTFAGAGLSLTTVTDAGVTRIRGAKRGLGYPRQGSESFSTGNVILDVAPGDTFYLMTDGITDQMGIHGTQRRLLGYRGVADILLRTRGEELGRQIGTLETELAAYRGSETPRDDMTLVAFRPKRQT